MNEADDFDRSIDSLLSESGFGGDAELTTMLVRARAEATAIRPLPAPRVARLMTTRPRRGPRHDRRIVVVFVVGATLLGGGAAAATPLLGMPGVATAISALVGADHGAGAPAPVPTSSTAPTAGTDPGSLDDQPHPSPSATHGASSSHPTPRPGEPNAPTLPAPALTHAPVPTPTPAPRSTHASDHPGR